MDRVATNMIDAVIEMISRGTLDEMLSRCARALFVT